MTGSKKQRGRPNKLMNKFMCNYISRSVRISGRLRSDCVVEIIGGVTLCESFFLRSAFHALANSQTFDSRINNRLYGTQCAVV